MFAGKAIRCECGYEVRASDEDTLVEGIRRHASEAHGIAFTVELARKLARGATEAPSDANGERARTCRGYVPDPPLHESNGGVMS
jgi:predicted small metal-binding protein